MPAQTQRRARYIAVGVLFVSALVLLVLALASLVRRQTASTVAEAQAQEAASRRNLIVAIDITRLADRVSGRVFLTNSAMYRDIHSAGNAVVQKLSENTAVAATEVHLASIAQAATQRVQRYADYNSA